MVRPEKVAVQAARQKTNIAVFGAGSFGTAMAHILAGNGHAVTLWSHDKNVADEIAAKRVNSSYHPNFKLAPFEATSHALSALPHKKIILFAIPCQFLRKLLENIKNLVPADAILVNLAKGIELDSLKRPSQIFEDVFSSSVLERFATLSGPTFAKELILAKPSAAAVAGVNHRTVVAVQQAISMRFFRLYTVADLNGVELGGALKNVMAIAVGIADGLGFGHNARAGLMTRCLHEMIELGTAMGAKERTFSGLSGIGDLILTCTGDLSRNRQVGLRLGRGETLQGILESSHQVAEGVATAKAVYLLMKKHRVEMPNAEHVYRIICEGMAPREAVERILSRELRHEF